MLLSQLVGPEQVKSFSGGVTMLRKWQQQFYRVKELHATLPDPSLLLRGVDTATGTLLSQNPLLGFRVNAFRNRISLDYNPSVMGVLQLVRLLQAEFESASLSADAGTVDKRARLAGAQAEASGNHSSSVPKATPSKAASEVLSAPQAKVLDGAGASKGGGKGKGKSKDGGEGNLCHHFSDGKGCKYGDACHFRHDRAQARKQKRCLACGQEGHYCPDCSLLV